MDPATTKIALRRSRETKETPVAESFVPDPKIFFRSSATSAEALFLNLDQLDKIRIKVAVVQHVDNVQHAGRTVRVVCDDQHVQTFIGHDHAALRHEQS